MDKLRLKLIKAVGKVVFDGSYSNLVLTSSLEEIPERRDKSTFTKKFYGIIERKLTLEYCVQNYCSKKLNKLDREVYSILLLGTYELLYMDAIPARAAVNEAVAACKAVKKTSASGMVNAVLRQIDRNKQELLDEIQKNPILKYSIPTWLLQRLYKDLSKEQTHLFLEDSLKTPPIYIHIKKQESFPEGAAEDTCLQGCKRLMDQSFLQDADARGWYVQDLASQLCVAAIPAAEGDTVIDLCAAPGGKSFLLSEKIKETGAIWSCDISENKCHLMKTTAEKLHISNQHILVNDASVFSEHLPQADVVLCDVPCSGFGVIRRRPEIKYKQEPQILQLPKRQLEILITGAKYVKKGGCLIYSTCTVLNEENHGVINKFLSQDSRFQMEKLPAMFFGENAGECTLLPQINGSDGFYVCRMRRVK